MKLTLAQLTQFTSTYVAAQKQAAAWEASTNNFIGLLDKIGKQVTIDGNFNDKLPELDGEELPLGSTIEEYFIDLTLPEVYTNLATEMAKENTPNLPTVEDVAYSYTLKKVKNKTTRPFNDIERAMLSTDGTARAVNMIMKRFMDSYSLYKYNVKKQLLANVITKAAAAGGLVKTIAKPTDTASGEAFIKALMEAQEDAQFANEGNCLSKALIGSTENLVLYVSKKVLPSLKVDTYAGALHREDLATNITIKVIDDFGAYNGNAFAVLVDPRGVKLHEHYHAVRSKENADGDAINFVRHSEHTAFISKYTFVRVFEAPAA